MLYFLAPLKDIHIFFNLFRYITFRAACASIMAFFICIWIAPRMIRWLARINVIANQQREHADSIHAFYAHKKKVPTMGGLLIVISVTVSVLLWANLTNRFVWMLLFVVLSFGAVGFIDDWLKLKSQSCRGLKSQTKFIGQVLLGMMLGVYLYLDPNFDKWLYLPFLKQGTFYLGFFFIPFVVLVLVGSSNALNLTDGLDGLAIGCTIFTATALAIVAYLVGRADFTSYLSIPYIVGAGEVTVVAAALIGASAGFLWFNCFPADVVMGDTGSLPLGGLLGAMAILIKKEALLVIAGGIFVWEALSVILQVLSFKLFRKRIFLMSPFHHHLQLKGWPESKVTVRLWIIALLLAVLSLSTLKVQ